MATYSKIRLDDRQAGFEDCKARMICRKFYKKGMRIKGNETNKL
jgi:hypothetical protein